MAPCVAQDINDSVVAVLIEHGAHHVDLMFSNEVRCSCGASLLVGLTQACESLTPGIACVHTEGSRILQAGTEYGAEAHQEVGGPGGAAQQEARARSQACPEPTAQPGAQQLAAAACRGLMRVEALAPCDLCCIGFVVLLAMHPATGRCLDHIRRSAGPNRSSRGLTFPDEQLPVSQESRVISGCTSIHWQRSVLGDRKPDAGDVPRVGVRGSVGISDLRM